MVAGAAGSPSAAPPHLSDFTVIDPAIRVIIERLLEEKPNQRRTTTEVIEHPWVRQGIKLGECKAHVVFCPSSRTYKQRVFGSTARFAQHTCFAT